VAGVKARVISVRHTANTIYMNKLFYGFSDRPYNFSTSHKKCDSKEFYASVSFQFATIDVDVSVLSFYFILSLAR
jgi:hypothetical protein